MSTEAWRRLILIVLGLLILGGVGFLIAVRLHRWPRIHAAFLRLGDAAITMALGLVGLALVVVVLRALGWIPPT